jgi:hypothetical protein
MFVTMQNSVSRRALLLLVPSETRMAVLCNLVALKRELCEVFIR